MGLSDWINRYIVDVKPAEGAAEAQAPQARPGPRPAAPPAGAPEPRRVRDVVEAAPPAAPDAEIESLLAEARATRAPRPDPASPAQPAKPGTPQATARPPARAASPPARPPTQPTGRPPAPPALADPLDDGGEPPARLEQVYAVAKIGRPAHGFGLERIAQMLADPRLAALDEAARAGAVAVLLESGGAKVEQIVEDAALRDRALDQFEGFLEQKVTTLEADLAREDARHHEEIERLIAARREAIERNAARVLEKKKELARFRRVKRAEERRLFDVVRHFTSENPVTLSGPVAPLPSLEPEPAPEPEPEAAPEPSALLDAADTGVFKPAPKPADPYAEMAARLRKEREGGGEAPR